MKKRDYSKKEMAIIMILSIVMLASAVLLNKFFPSKSQETASDSVTVTASAVATATPVPTPTPDPTEKIATFFQGPKAWESRLAWSGAWAEEYYDGGKFGSFGCGLCCMASIYTTVSPYECSPIDMYEYAKKLVAMVAVERLTGGR